nr:monocarboxylate transporter 2-like [Onthophagus taurus]
MAEKLTEDKEDKKSKALDGGYGWVVIFAIVAINSALSPIVVCFGMLYEAKFLEMGITASQISFLLHLNNSLQCALGLFSGPLLKVFTNKQIVLGGGCLSCLSLVLTTLSWRYEYLLCTIGVMLGVGNGILMPATYMMVYSYFEKKLALAISLQVTGSCLIGIFMPQVCHFLLQYYGVQGTVLIFAGFALNMFPAALLLHPLKGREYKNKKTSKIILPHDDKNGLNDKLISTNNNNSLPKEKKNMCRSVTKLFDFKLFTEATYVILALGMGVSFASELNTIVMTPFVLTRLNGFNIQELAIAISWLSSTDLTGRLVVPFITYKMNLPPKVCYVCSLMASSIGRTIMAVFYDQKYIVLIGVATLGLGKGSKAVFQSLILPRYVEYERLAAANGLLMVTNGILSLVVGPVIGLAHDLANSYIYSLYATTALSMFCVILWSCDYLIRPKVKKVTEESSSTESNA